MKRLVLLACLLFVLVPASSTRAQSERCFPETGLCISGAIRAYWEANGGLPVFGYPITAVVTETNAEGFTGPTQWFERDRLEDHAGVVMAGRLGAQKLAMQGRPWEGLPKVTSAAPGCVFFPQTGHSLCQPFRAYWERNGGLPRFGYPISELAIESNDAGFTGTFQWFERRRMEAHPENQPPYDVLLGLLGKEVRGGSVSPPPPPPPPPGVPILSTSDFQSSSGYRRLIGEVGNDTGQTIEFVELIASFYNASGQIAGTDSGYSSMEILTPGQRSPFTVLYEANQPYASHKLQVEWRATTKQPLGGITILSSGRRDSSSGYERIFGEVRNDSGGPLKFVEIVATLYAASGQVVGDESGYTALDTLAAGQTSPFEILVTKRGATRYELQVQGRRP